MRLRALPLVVATGLILTACSAEDTAEKAENTETFAEPITIDNCGVTLTFESVPQRASTLEQGSTDTLLLLGAKDNMVGYGHQKDLPPEGYSLDGLKEISPAVPTSEQLRDADTDFILSPFSASFSAATAGTREE